MSIRPRRVGDLLRSLVAELLAREIEDPRLALVSITEARVTPDLRHATLLYTVLGSDPKAREEAARALAGATGFLRREVARRTRLRISPELAFEPDRGIEHALHVDQVLREVLPPGDDEGGDGEAS